MCNCVEQGYQDRDCPVHGELATFISKIHADLCKAATVVYRQDLTSMEAAIEKICEGVAEVIDEIRSKGLAAQVNGGRDAG